MCADRVEERLIEMLEAEQLSTRQRRRVLSELRDIATERSIAVLRRYLRDADMKSRARAVLALSRLSADDAADALIETLKTDSGPPLTLAVKALAARQVTRAVPFLIDALDERHSQLTEGNKVVIIGALVEMPHKSAVPALGAILHSRCSRDTRKVAAMALAHIRAPEARSVLEEAAQSMSWLQGASLRRALRWRTETYGE